MIAPRTRTIADRYVLDAAIGGGGIGIVYAAHDDRTGARVAVKVMRRELASDSTLVERMVREARTAQSIRHPNCVRVFDTGVSADGEVFIALELLEGETLAALLARERPLSRERAWAILSPMMDALAAVHALGLVHRDVKPENVFLSREGDMIVPKLLDFGMVTASGSRVTDPREALGTVGYSAPEMLMGLRGLDPTVDIWSIGIVWFEALSGRAPYTRKSASATLLAVIDEPLPGLDELRTRVGHDVVAALERALHKTPSQRFQSMTEFSTRLREALERAAEPQGDDRSGS